MTAVMTDQLSLPVSAVVSPVSLVLSFVLSLVLSFVLVVVSVLPWLQLSNWLCRSSFSLCTWASSVCTRQQKQVTVCLGAPALTCPMQAKQATLLMCCLTAHKFQQHTWQDFTDFRAVESCSQRLDEETQPSVNAGHAVLHRSQ